MPYRDLETLRRGVAAGSRPKFLFFWGHTPQGAGADKSCLSQWFEAPFIIDGEDYPTAEHYMMASKAALFGDDALLETILDSETPGEAKALGRKVRGFDHGVWEAHRIEIVVAGNVAKFSQNPGLLSFLLNTRERVLVEASPKDRIWGIGLSEHDEDAYQPQQWRGLNLLGFALMEARFRCR
mgnify:CR=1 FL=1